MKRHVAFILAVLTLILCGCSAVRTDITREEIINGYTAAGYEVSSKEYDEVLEYGQIAYLKASQPNGDYIYFTFFESEQAAKDYKEQFYHPGMMGLFSVIFGDPSWMRWQAYGNMVIEYDQPEFYDIFENLLKTK